MLIDIADIRKREAPLRLEALRSQEEIGLESDFARLLDPVHFTCRVSAPGERVQISGTLVTRLGLTCSRCLGVFDFEIDRVFDLSYLEDPQVEPDDEELSLSYEDLDYGFYRNDELDLEAVLLEQILLEIPMKPICRADCKGLCDQCGADLNLALCGCEREYVDPRWAALKKLKNRLDQ